MFARTLTSTRERNHGHHHRRKPPNRAIGPVHAGGRRTFFDGGGFFGNKGKKGAGRFGQAASRSCSLRSDSRGPKNSARPRIRRIPNSPPFHTSPPGKVLGGPFSGADSQQPVHEASPKFDGALGAEFVAAVTADALFVVYECGPALGVEDRNRARRA